MDLHKLSLSVDQEGLDMFAWMENKKGPVNCTGELSSRILKGQVESVGYTSGP